jgi:hypothetical protein
MLASTVQFSRNGQHHRPPSRTRETTAPACKRKPGKTPASSGPNSVPTRPGDQDARSAPPKGNVLAAPSRAGQVNSQCSTRKHERPVSHSLT